MKCDHSRAVYRSVRLKMECLKYGNALAAALVLLMFLGRIDHLP